MADNPLFPEATRQVLAALVSTEDDRDAVAMVSDLHPSIAAGLLLARSESRAEEGKGMGDILSGRAMPPALAAAVLQGSVPVAWVYDGIIAGRLLYVLEQIGTLAPKPEEQHGETCIFRNDGSLFTRMLQLALVDPKSRLNPHVKTLADGRFEVPVTVAVRIERAFQQISEIMERVFDDDQVVLPDPENDWRS